MVAGAPLKLRVPPGAHLPPAGLRPFPCDITAPPSAAAARERRARGGSGGAQPRQPTRSLAAATTLIPNREVAGGHFRLRKKPQTLQEAGLGSTESPASTPSLRRRRWPRNLLPGFVQDPKTISRSKQDVLGTQQIFKCRYYPSFLF